MCPRLLKDCAAQLAEPLQWIFNMSLRTGKVLVQWKTSCLVLVPKVGRPAELNDDRPVALTSHIWRSSTGAPQGTVLAPFLFTFYTADLKCSSESGHVPKYSDDIAIVACIRSGQEQEYRDLVDAFRDWCSECCLHLNTAKTKEMVVDFRRFHQPVSTQGGGHWGGAHLEKIWGSSWMISWTGPLTPTPSTGRGRAACSVCGRWGPLMCVCWHVEHVLSRCGGQCTLQRCSVLGRQLDGQKHQAIGQAG